MKRLQVPQLPQNPALERYLRDQAAIVDVELLKRTRDDTTRKSILLSSTDDESVWEVTVDSTGTLTTTKVSG